MTIVVTGVIATGLAIYLRRGPPGVVTVGTSFADSKPNPTLHPNDPLRILLALPDAITDDELIDFEVRDQHRSLLMYTIRDQRRHDEVYVSWPKTSQVVRDQAGRFFVRFIKQGRLLGEGSFTVVR